MAYEEIVARARQEILDDIRQGVVPATVTSFSDLHAYVDANEYGGVVDLVDQLPVEVLDEIQNAIDAWLKSRR